MSYINRRKALVEARDAAKTSRERFAIADKIEAFDRACQPQVEALVEAVANWRDDETWRYTDSVDEALAALDARADEVAGGGE